MSRRVGLASAVALLLSNSAASPGGGGDGNAAHAASCDASADPHLVSARQKEQGGWRRDGYQSAIGLFNKSVETSNDPEAHHSLAFFRATGLGAPALPHDDAAAVAHEAAASRAGLASALMAMGFRYLHGLGVPEDCESALARYRAVADALMDPDGDDHLDATSMPPSDDDLVYKGMGADRRRQEHEEDQIRGEYERLAKVGDANAQYELGYALQLGTFGAPKDPEKAAQYFKMAAVQGHTPALAALGRAYVEGVGVGVDGEAALKLLDRAVADGSAAAKTTAGRVYLRGLAGIPSDRDLAVELLEEAAQASDPEALFELGVVHAAEGQPDLAFQYFQSGAELGFMPAVYREAKMYDGGLGAQRSCSHAVLGFKDVAEAGNRTRTLMAAGMGALRAGDEEGAALSFAKAAEGANVPGTPQRTRPPLPSLRPLPNLTTAPTLEGVEAGMYNAGWLAAHRGKGCQSDGGGAGRGVLASLGLYKGGDGGSGGERSGTDAARCPVVALRYFDRAALQGNPESLFEAAKLYDTGTLSMGGTRHGGGGGDVALGREGATGPRPKVAVEYLTAAAEQGHAAAILDLARMHEKGRGTAQNIVYAEHLVMHLLKHSKIEGGSLLREVGHQLKLVLRLMRLRQHGLVGRVMGMMATKAGRVALLTPPLAGAKTSAKTGMTIYATNVIMILIPNDLSTIPTHMYTHTHTCLRYDGTFGECSPKTSLWTVVASGSELESAPGPRTLLSLSGTRSGEAARCLTRLGDTAARASVVAAPCGHPGAKGWVFDEVGLVKESFGGMQCLVRSPATNSQNADEAECEICIKAGKRLRLTRHEATMDGHEGFALMHETEADPRCLRVVVRKNRSGRDWVDDARLVFGVCDGAPEQLLFGLMQHSVQGAGSAVLYPTHQPARPDERAGEPVCLEREPNGGVVGLASCSTSGRQQWLYRGGRLEDSRGRNCLAMTGGDVSAEPDAPLFAVMRSCSDVEAGKLSLLTS